MEVIKMETETTIIVVFILFYFIVSCIGIIHCINEIGRLRYRIRLLEENNISEKKEKGVRG
jgi:predicted transcriptional regulator